MEGDIIQSEIKQQLTNDVPQCNNIVIAWARETERRRFDAKCSSASFRRKKVIV